MTGLEPLQVAAAKVVMAPGGSTEGWMGAASRAQHDRLDRGTRFFL
jgi:hypothetical protein